MQHTTPRKIYYFKYRVLVLFFACVLSVWAIWNLADKQSYIEFAFVLLLNILLITTYQTRIITSPNGISYYNSGLYSIHSTWQEVEKISIIKFRVIGNYRCLIVKNGKRLGWWTGLACAISREERGCTIPIPDNGNWSKLNELIADIERYIPDVKGLD